MKLRRSYMLLVLWAVISCDPVEIPKPKHTAPVFNAELKVNGRDLRYEVGKNSIVNRPSYIVDSDRRIAFTSVLEKKDCAGDCEQFSFGFTGDRLYKDNSKRFGDYFHDGSWDYQWRYLRREYEMQLYISQVLRGGYMEQWMIGDQVIKEWELVQPNRTNPASIFFDNLPETTFELCRHVRKLKKPLLLQSASCKRLNLNEFNSSSPDSLQVSIVIEKVLKDNNYLLLAEVHGSENMRTLQYRWSISGEQQSRIKVQSLQGKTIRVEVQDPKTDYRAIAYLRVESEIDLRDLPLLPKTSNYWVKEVKRATNRDKQQLGTVVLNYTAPDGKKYTSSLYRQPQGSYFKVISIDDFVEDDSPKQYKKVEVEFDGILYSRQEAISVEGGRATLAIDYPQ